jgi:hypothetical protein
MAVAVILLLCFAPLGVWYATFGGRQSLIGMLFTGGAVLALVWAPGATWMPIILISVIWSVLAVRAHNRQILRS